MTITKQDLERLLTAKVEAKIAWDEASRNANKLTSTDPADQRVTLDLERHRLMKAYCRADEAYDAGLSAYIEEEKTS